MDAPDAASALSWCLPGRFSLEDGTETEVEYPLLRACSSSAAVTAAGLHTQARTHRTSSDPACLIK
jgi:hypothetical protein